MYSRYLPSFLSCCHPVHHSFQLLLYVSSCLTSPYWAPVQIRSGSNGRHRHPEGRQEESLPCHPDTLRDALRRVAESAWLQAQEAGVQPLYQRQLVRGKDYVVDGWLRRRTAPGGFSVCISYAPDHRGLARAQ